MRMFGKFSSMDKLGIKSRRSFKKNYLDPLLQSDMIEMTILDKPKSRNQ